MSPSETTDTYAWRQFSHRRTVVDAVFYDGTEHCRRWIARAVTLGGGETLDQGHGDLHIHGARGFLPLRSGEWCVRSIDVPGRGREFFPMGDDIMTEAYEPMGGDDHSAVLTRDQAAAIVVNADQVVEAARDTSDAGWLRRAVYELADGIHLLGASGEALR